MEYELKTFRDAFRAQIETLNTRLQQAYLEKNTLSLNMEQVASKLAESEKAFASIQKEINELNSQIAEINTNKDQLADNNKKHEAAKVQCEEMIKELESKHRVSLQQQIQRFLNC